MEGYKKNKTFYRKKGLAGGSIQIPIPKEMQLPVGSWADEEFQEVKLSGGNKNESINL